MGKLIQAWKNLTATARTAFILIALFLLVGMGTLGSVQSVGSAVELNPDVTIVFQLDRTEEQNSLQQIYINVGTVYTEAGENASIRMRYANSTASFYSNGMGLFYVENVLPEQVEEGQTAKTAHKDALFQWIAPYDLSTRSNPLDLTSYVYYELSVTNCHLLINEVVFVADDGEVVPAKVDAVRTRGIEAEQVEGLIDAQSVPSISQSSFFRYGQEEVYSMMTIAEMYRGKSFAEGSTYRIDGVNGALGYSFLALSTAVFGMSPFGLRFFPMLASFGVLVLGYLLCKRLFADERASLAFVLLYILAGAPLSLGHLGTPLMIGAFFLVLSYFTAHTFYSRGLKRASVSAGGSLVASGLSAAAAICINGALAIPALGTVALFVLGMVRQHQAKKYRISKASVEEANTISSQFRYKDRLALTLFPAALLVGAFLLSLLALLPVYYPYVKAYDNAATPTLTLFELLWRSFTGGFIGTNAVSSSQSGWNYLYRLFTGNGEKYAVTLATFGTISGAFALAGILFAVVRLIKVLVMREKGKETRKLVRSLAIPLAGVGLSLIAAIFASQTVLFLAIAYACGYLLAGGALSVLGEKSTLAKVLFFVGLGLLLVQFFLLVPFVFSIPLPAAWQTALFF